MILNRVSSSLIYYSEPLLTHRYMQLYKLTFVYISIYLFYKHFLYFENDGLQMYQ